MNAKPAVVVSNVNAPMSKCISRLILLPAAANADRSEHTNHLANVAALDVGNLFWIYKRVHKWICIYSRTHIHLENARSRVHESPRD